MVIEKILAGRWLTPVGIDIGSRSIKLCQLRVGRNGLRIRALAIKELPCGMVDGETIAAGGLLNDHLEEMIEDARVRGRRAILAVSGRSVLTRVIQLPVMPDNELAAALEWEVKQAVSLTDEELVIDYEIGSRRARGDGGELEAICFGVREGLVEDYVELASRVGLKTIAVDTEATALARAFRWGIAGGLDVPQEVCVVEVGASKTNILFLRAGELGYVRTVDSGGEDFTARLARMMNTDRDTAEKMKIDGEVETRSRTAEMTGGLTAELTRSLSYYTSSYGSRPEKILLLGGGARLYYLPEIIEEETGIPVEFGNVLEHVQLPDEPGGGRNPGELAMRIGVVLGLALWGRTEPW